MRQLMLSPNHGTLRLPNDDDEEDTVIVSYGLLLYADDLAIINMTTIDIYSK